MAASMLKASVRAPMATRSSRRSAVVVRAADEPLKIGINGEYTRSEAQEARSGKERGPLTCASYVMPASQGQQHVATPRLSLVRDKQLGPCRHSACAVVANRHVPAKP